MATVQSQNITNVRDLLSALPSKIYPEFGLDAANDFALAHRISEVPANPGMGWSVGNAGLDSATSFRLLDVLSQSDAGLARILATESRFELWSRAWYQLRGDARIDFVYRTNNSAQQDFRPYMLKFDNQLCPYLKTKAT